MINSMIFHSIHAVSVLTEKRSGRKFGPRFNTYGKSSLFAFILFEAVGVFVISTTVRNLRAPQARDSQTRQNDKTLFPASLSDFLYGRETGGPEVAPNHITAVTQRGKSNFMIRSGFCEKVTFCFRRKYMVWQCSFRQTFSALD